MCVYVGACAFKDPVYSLIRRAGHNNAKDGGVSIIRFQEAGNGELVLKLVGIRLIRS